MTEVIKPAPTRKVVEETLKIYGEAWETQNPDLIPSIFAKDATYLEGPFTKPMIGVEEIREYWKKKVVEEQSNISFKVNKILIAGNEVMAVWVANFDDLVTGERVCLYEMAFMVFEGDYIWSLFEVWRSSRRPL